MFKESFLVKAVPEQKLGVTGNSVGQQKRWGPGVRMRRKWKQNSEHKLGDTMSYTKKPELLFCM